MSPVRQELPKRLYSLVDEVKETHQPVQIVGKRSSAVLVSEEDWNTFLLNNAKALKSFRLMRF